MLPIPALTCLALFLTPTAFQQPNDKPSYRVVTYAELMQEVKSHKGKVIVVDLWTDG